MFNSAVISNLECGGLIEKTIFSKILKNEIKMQRYGGTSLKRNIKQAEGKK